MFPGDNGIQHTGEAGLALNQRVGGSIPSRRALVMSRDTVDRCVWSWFTVRAVANAGSGRARHPRGNHLLLTTGRRLGCGQGRAASAPGVSAGSCGSDWLVSGSRVRLRVEDGSSVSSSAMNPIAPPIWSRRTALII